MRQSNGRLSIRAGVLLFLGGMLGVAMIPAVNPIKPVAAANGVGGGPIAVSVLGSGDSSTLPLMHSLDSLYLFSPGCQQLAPSGTQWLDFSCLSPDPAGTVTTENYEHDQVHEAPFVDSDHGIQQMCQTPRVIDFARSSRGPSSSTTCTGLHFVEYATNAFNVYCDASCPGGASSTATTNYIGENGWICKGAQPPAAVDSDHATNPITGNNYRTDITNAITLAGFVPIPFGTTGGGDTNQSYCRLWSVGGVTWSAGDTQAVVNWTPYTPQNASIDGATPTGYTITTNNPAGFNAASPVTVTGATANTATITGLTDSLTQASHAGYTFTVVPNFASGTGGAVPTALVFPQVASGQFNPLPPARILDTRASQGPIGACTPSPCATLTGSAETTELAVAGHGGVPATGVAAVVMNVTVTAPTNTMGMSWLTVWPSGTTEPTVSNANYADGVTAPNLVTVKLGSDGGVNIANAHGSAEVIADVAGWYSDTSTSSVAASRYNPVSPLRILDTRAAVQTGSCTPSCSTLGAGSNPETVRLRVAGRGGVPGSGVAAVVLNVTAVSPAGTTGLSWLTAWPSDGAKPLASNLNYVDGQVVPNLVTVKLGPDGTVNIANDHGSVDVVADVAGWYAATGTITGTRFTPVAPLRVLDTRASQGPIGTCTPSPCATLGAGSNPEVASFKVAGQGTGGVPATGATAAVMNATVTGTASTGVGSWLTLWPANAIQPLASNLNYVDGLTIANLAALKLGTGGSAGLVKMANAHGQVDVIADVAGWFNDGTS